MKQQFANNPKQEDLLIRNGRIYTKDTRVLRTLFGGTAVYDSGHLA